MRDLMETVAHQPIKSRFKIYIIDEVHMLSQHSFNALAEDARGAAAARQVHLRHDRSAQGAADGRLALPALRPPAHRARRADARTSADVCAAEGVDASRRRAAPCIAREAEGSLRDAQSLLDQVLAAGGRALRRGRGPRRSWVRPTGDSCSPVADAVLAGDAAACLEHLAQLYGHGYDAQRFCRDLLEHFRHLAVLRATGDRRLLAELPEAEVEALAAQAEPPLGRRPAALLSLAARGRRGARPRRRARSIPSSCSRCASCGWRRCRRCCRVDEILRRLRGPRRCGGGRLRRGAAPPGDTKGSHRPTAPVASADRRSTCGSRSSRAAAAGEGIAVHDARRRAGCSASTAACSASGIENEAMRRELGQQGDPRALAAIAARSRRDGRSASRSDRCRASSAGETPLARRGSASEDTLADPWSRRRSRSSGPRCAPSAIGGRDEEHAMGKGFDLGGLFKQAQELQERLARVQEELAGRTVEASAGRRHGARPSSTASSRCCRFASTRRCSRRPTSRCSQDLVVAAVNDGIRAAQQMVADEMGKVTGGLGIKLPGMP